MRQPGDGHALDSLFTALNGEGYFCAHSPAAMRRFCALYKRRIAPVNFLIEAGTAVCGMAIVHAAGFGKEQDRFRANVRREVSRQLVVVIGLLEQEFNGGKRERVVVVDDGNYSTLFL